MSGTSGPAPTVDARITARLTEFRADLATRDVRQLVQRHITTGQPFLLGESQYLDLRAKVASEFALHPNQVLMVGSGKLGFSLVSEKRYRHFCDDSDIDLALVSSELFDRYGEAVFDFWRQSPYWPEFEKFKTYFFRGWIRPDKLPKITLKRDWWEFFRGLTATGAFGPYKLRAGLYKSWHHLDSYHSVLIEECKRLESA